MNESIGESEKLGMSKRLDYYSFKEGTTPTASAHLRTSEERSNFFKTFFSFFLNANTEKVMYVCGNLSRYIFICSILFAE